MRYASGFGFYLGYFGMAYVTHLPKAKFGLLVSLFGPWSQQVILVFPGPLGK